MSATVNTIISGTGQLGVTTDPTTGLGELDTTSRALVESAIRDWHMDDHAVLYSNLATDGTDVSTLMQADIDSLWTMSSGSGGTYILKDGATYTVQGLVWRPGITLRSENIFSTFTENQTYFEGAKLKLPSTATGPLISNDTANGYVRATSSSGSNASQRYGNLKMMGVMLCGSRRVTDHLSSCDLIHLESVWNVTLANVMFCDSRGFGLRALDCNTILMTGCSAISAPIFLDSVADSKFIGNNFGGGNGLCPAVVWLTGDSCWKNEFTSNFIFNCNGNGSAAIVNRLYTFKMTVGTVSAANDTIAFSGNDVDATTSHYWETETPVVLHLVGGATVPTGLKAGTTYYVTKVDAATIKLSTSIRNCRDAVFVNITGTGSGTMYMTAGMEANLLLSSGANDNTILGGRYDQGMGPGILCDAAPNNNLIGPMVHENYFGNYTGATIDGAVTISPTPDAGIVIRNSSTNTSICGGSSNGRKLGTAGTVTGYESKQKYGLSIDATSRVGTVTERSFKCWNHTTSNSESGALNYKETASNPNRIYVGISQFRLKTGTPVIGGIDATPRQDGWLMDAASAEVIATDVLLPPGWSNFTLSVVWANAGAGAGNVVWYCDLAYQADGGDLGAAAASGTTLLTTTALARGLKVTSTWPKLTLPNTSGLEIFLRLKRVGTDAADTLANDVGVVGLVIQQED